jgi:hypothetical protein
MNPFAQLKHEHGGESFMGKLLVDFPAEPLIETDCPGICFDDSQAQRLVASGDHLCFSTSKKLSSNPSATVLFANPEIIDPLFIGQYRTGEDLALERYPGP